MNIDFDEKIKIVELSTLSNLIFQMNMEIPKKPNQTMNKNKNKKLNNTKKANRKLTTVYANKYVNKPSVKQPFAPINQKTIQNMNKYYKNTPF